MNASSNVISVNPGLKTIGALNQDLPSIFRHKVINKSSLRINNKVRSRVDSFFGISKAVSPLASLSLMALRFIFACFVCFCTATDAFGVFPLPIDIAIYTFCAIFCLGIFNRMISILFFVAFLLVSIDARLSADSDYMALITALSSLILAITGPGMFSIDGSLRCGIFRTLKRQSDRREIAKRSSYKAYSYI